MTTAPLMGLPHPVARTSETVASPTVIVGIDSWRLSGVTSFAVNLVLGLRSAGYNAKLLSTNSPWAAPGRLMKPPAGFDYDSLPMVRVRGWPARWRLLTAYLKAHAPCVYIPNTDIGFAAASPLLAEDVMPIGVLHSDEPFHYEHAQRVGSAWSAIACVSDLIARKARIACPDLDPAKFVAIRNSVPSVSSVYPERSESQEGIRLLYAGRVSQYQKRVFDLISICEELGRSSVSYSMTIAGDGPDRLEFEQRAAKAGITPNLRFLGTVTTEAVLDEMKRHHCLLLTSEFEGMPMVMLEAMSTGCIPVVTRIESGVTEMIVDGKNGFLCPVGDHSAFSQAIKHLADDPMSRRTIAKAAWESLQSGPHSFTAFIGAWDNLITQVFNAAGRAPFHRLRGPARPHPYMPVSTSDRVIWRLRSLRNRIKTLFGRATML